MYLPDEPDWSIYALCPQILEVLTWHFIEVSISKEIFDGAVDERRAFIPMLLLQFNTVASDAPIGEYFDSSQHHACNSVNFIEKPERFAVRHLFLGPSPAIIPVYERIAHDFTVAEPLMQ